MQRKDSIEFEDRIMNMNTGDTLIDSITGWRISCVPGGWIYDHDAVAVFVPKIAKQKKEAAKPEIKPITKPDGVVLPAKKTRGK